jgi:outer membrane biosynthesis protein TonB
MSVTGLQETSLRPSRFEHKRLLWALIISLAIHGGGYGAYRLERAVMPVLLQRFKILAALAEALHKKPVAQPPTPSEPPLAFIDVNPNFAAPEPPKEAKYYSSQNSHAANPDATIDSNIPKITGKQQEVTKTEDAPRKFDKLQPTPAPAKEPQPAEVAKPKPPVGDLAMAKPETILHPDNGNAEHTRPRTIAEAKARQPNNVVPGPKMNQDGGVRRRLETSLMDAQATPLGAYDAAFIAAVRQHWYDLLDSMNFSFDRHGHVVLQFHLNYDGTITDMQVVDDTVDPTLDGVMGFLCQRAVNEPAPFERWPREMRLQFEKDYREIQFTFFYD